MDEVMSTQLSSEAVTNGVQVTVVPTYVAENSNPTNNEYLFSYEVTIKNNSDQDIKIVSRNWIIIDADGKKESVIGSGVVGQTPTIPVGDVFEYQSFCPLKTFWGTMEGIYSAEDSNGNLFDIKINRFYLVSNGTV